MKRGSFNTNFVGLPLFPEIMLLKLSIFHQARQHYKTGAFFCKPKASSSYYEYEISCKTIPANNINEAYQQDIVFSYLMCELFLPIAPSSNVRFSGKSNKEQSFGKEKR